MKGLVERKPDPRQRWEEKLKAHANKGIRSRVLVSLAEYRPGKPGEFHPLGPRLKIKSSGSLRHVRDGETTADGRKIAR
jgi:hypothetical protein